MWWEAIPCMAIMCGALYIGLNNSKAWHLLMFGVPYRRDLTMCFDRTMYFRDARLSGSPYIPLGLDSLPDKPENVK